MGSALFCRIMSDRSGGGGDQCHLSIEQMPAMEAKDYRRELGSLVTAGLLPAVWQAVKIWESNSMMNRSGSWHDENSLSLP